MRLLLSIFAVFCAILPIEIAECESFPSETLVTVETVEDLAEADDDIAILRPAVKRSCQLESAEVPLYHPSEARSFRLVSETFPRSPGEYIHVICSLRL